MVTLVTMVNNMVYNLVNSKNPIYVICDRHNISSVLPESLTATNNSFNSNFLAIKNEEIMAATKIILAHYNQMK